MALEARKARLISKLLLSAGTIGLVLVVGETIYWRRAVRARYEMLAGRSAEALITRAAPPPLRYDLKPNFTNATNARGFRDVERTIAKPQGVFRIAVIGDSVTMQGALSFEELYATRLQNRFDHEYPGRVEVLNFGITGYNTVQEAGLLELRILDYEPDVVLWQFHDNDGQHALYSYALGAYYHRPKSYLANYVANKLDHFFCRQQASRHPAAPLSGDELNLLCHWDDVLESFTRSAAVLESRGVDFVVFLYPSWPPGDRWENYGSAGVELRRQLTEQLRSMGAEVVDLLPLLRQVNPAEYRVEPSDPWHPNARGHALIAGTLYHALEPRVSNWAIPSASITSGDDARP